MAPFSGYQGVHLPSLFQPSPTSIPVVDPKLKQFGRLWINVHRVEHSKAVERWISEDPRQSSLCLLFSKGECNAGDKCNQLHVDRAYTQAIRECLSPLHITNCCFAHGDIASIREDFQELLKKHPLELVIEGGNNAVAVPSNRVAVTAFWDQYLHDRNLPSGVLRISPGRVCRLHQRDSCKFGTDCNNMHICREFWSSMPTLNQSQPHSFQRKAPMPLSPSLRRDSVSSNDSQTVSPLASGASESTPPSPPQRENSVMFQQAQWRHGNVNSSPAITAIPQPERTSPIAIKVSSPKKTEQPAIPKKQVPPPLQMEILHEEPMSPFCLTQPLLSSPMFQIPSPEQSPNAYPSNYRQPLPKFQGTSSMATPPLAAARRASIPSQTPAVAQQQGAGSHDSVPPTSASSDTQVTYWSAFSFCPSSPAEQVPLISQQQYLQLQQSPPAKPTPSVFSARRQPLSTEKYLKFLMYTKSDASPCPQSLADKAKEDDASSPSTFLDQEDMLEKLPYCLLQALDYETDVCK